MKREIDSWKWYVDRESGRIVEENIVKEGMFNFFNNPGLGTFIGNLFYNSKFFHRTVTHFCESQISKRYIQKLIQAGNINTKETEFPTNHYKSLNEFFCRRLKPECRPFEMDEHVFISPGEGKLLINSISGPEQDVIIKGVKISIRDLLFNQLLADRYKGGQIAILRLYLGDYHRIHFPVSGIASAWKEYSGSYYPVSPFKTNTSNFYLKNHRVISELATKDFGHITTVMVGGFLISSIKLSYKPGYINKGNEQGLFAFGGSTHVWLSEKGAINYDTDIKNNSLEGIETYVKLGTQIGRSGISKLSKK